MNFIFSGPSDIAPNAKRAEYLKCHYGDVILRDTNVMTGSITKLPITYDTLSRQHPAESATPHSSLSSSISSGLILVVHSNNKIINS